MSGGGNPVVGLALVAAIDARLRKAAFDRLAALGYRVDAVGDARGLSRRLEKDRYALIVTDALEIPEVEGTRVVRVDPRVADDSSALGRAMFPDQPDLEQNE